MEHYRMKIRKCSQTMYCRIDKNLLSCKFVGFFSSKLRPPLLCGHRDRVAFDVVFFSLETLKHFFFQSLFRDSPWISRDKLGTMAQVWLGMTTSTTHSSFCCNYIHFIISFHGSQQFIIRQRIILPF